MSSSLAGYFPAGDYGKGLLDAKTRAEGVSASANLDALRKAVQAYHAANERYPASLAEAAALIGQSMDLSKYDYDPRTGAVSLRQ